jgi:hypothetical protein
MILNNQVSDTEVVGLTGTTEMNISLNREVQDHLIKVLTETGYKRPIESTVRETFCNGWDSHKAAGKENVPVIVRLTRQYFEIEDKGLGLDEASFDKYIMGIGESTKRQSADLIGAMGAGAKSPLSYGSSFEMVCRKDGVERKFLVFKGAKRPEKTKVYEKPTTLGNGVTTRVTLKSGWNEFTNFDAAIKKQLCYFPNIDFKVEGQTLNNYKVFRNDLFEWSSLYPSTEMHISLGGVNYPIDWDSIGMNRISVPVAIRIGLTEGVSFVFNREELNWTESTKELVKKRIKDVADWFMDKYDEQVKEFDTFKEAMPFLNQDTYRLTFQEKEFILNGLFAQASKEPEKPKVKGITLKDPGYYLNQKNYFFDEYSAVAFYTNHGIWKRDKINWYADLEKILINKSGTRGILVSELPTHKVKDFLMQKYGRNTAFYVHKKSRSLRGSAHLATYSNILNLKSHKKSEWRAVIQEWLSVVGEFTKDLINETGVDTSREYLDWEEKRKQAQKDNRRLGRTSGKSKTLGKVKGDITIGTARKHSNQNTLVFDKRAFPIAELHKIPRINVYFLETDFDKEINKDKLYDFYQAFKGQVSFVTLNVKELKHVNNLHNFITFRKFKKMAKPFARLATAIKIANLLYQVPASRQEYITESFPTWKTSYNDLKNYVSVNLGAASHLTDKIKNIILDEAEENNNWDNTIMADYDFMKKVLGMLYFLPLVKEDVYYDTPQLKEQRRKLVAGLLLLEKYKAKELQLVPITPVEVLQSMYADQTGTITTVDTDSVEIDELEEIYI